MSPEVKAIADEIKALSPAAQLRLAADLIEARQFTVAQPIVSRIGEELDFLLIASRAARTGSKEAP